MEQKLETVTRLKFDFVDRIQILFGRIPVVTVNVWVPMKVENYNSSSSVKLESQTKTKFTKDLPDYGYEAKS